MRRATNIAREALVSFGTCFGKFTKSGQFRLHITCLEYLAEFAKVGQNENKQVRENPFQTIDFIFFFFKYKMWLKPSAEMQFLYGNHVLKSGIFIISSISPLLLSYFMNTHKKDSLVLLRMHHDILG